MKWLAAIYAVVLSVGASASPPSATTASLPSSPGGSAAITSAASVISTSAAPTAGAQQSGGNATAPAPALAGTAPEDTAPLAQTTTTPTQSDDCYDDFEYSNNPELLDRLQKYDVAKVLAELGGAPGAVDVVRRADVPEMKTEAEGVPKDGPLPDTDMKEYWVYDYGATDWKTFIRVEHALVRHKGTAREYEDVRGEVWWSPPGLCGALRHAQYRRDAQGFVAKVLTAHCHIFRGDQTLSCYGPDSENPCAFCISGVSGSLIASLVG